MSPIGMFLFVLLLLSLSSSTTTTAAAAATTTTTTTNDEPLFLKDPTNVPLQSISEDNTLLDRNGRRISLNHVTPYTSLFSSTAFISYDGGQTVMHIATKAVFDITIYKGTTPDGSTLLVSKNTRGRINYVVVTTNTAAATNTTSDSTPTQQNGSSDIGGTTHFIPQQQESITTTNDTHTNATTTTTFLTVTDTDYDYEQIAQAYQFGPDLVPPTFTPTASPTTSYLYNDDMGPSYGYFGDDDDDDDDNGIGNTDDYYYYHYYNGKGGRGGTRKRNRLQRHQYNRHDRHRELQAQDWVYENGDGSSEECITFLVIPVTIFFDAEFCQLYNGDIVQAVSTIQLIVASASLFYETNLCARLELTGIYWDTISCNPDDSPFRDFNRDTCNPYLSAVTDYLNAERDGLGIDNNSWIHVFTGLPIQTVLGCSWQPGPCGSTFVYGVDYASYQYPDIRGPAYVLAHELGHNFGAPHDPSNPEPPDWIMEERPNDGQDGFSPFSQILILNSLLDPLNFCVYQEEATSTVTPTTTIAPPTNRPTLRPPPFPFTEPTPEPTRIAPPSDSPTTLAPITLAPSLRPITTFTPTTQIPPTPNPTTRPPTPTPTTRPPTPSPTTRPPTASPTTRPPTASPTTRPPTASPTTRPPVPTPTLPPPTPSPTPFPPTLAPTTPSPTTIPTTLPPTLAPITLPPSPIPTTLPPTIAPITFPPSPIPTTLPPTLLPTTLPPSPIPTTLPPTIAPITLPPSPIPTTLPLTLAPITLPPSPIPTTLPPTIAPITLPPTLPPSPSPTTLPPSVRPTTTRPTTSSPTIQSNGVCDIQQRLVDPICIHASQFDTDYTCYNKADLLVYDATLTTSSSATTTTCDASRIQLSITSCSSTYLQYPGNSRRTRRNLKRTAQQEDTEELEFFHERDQYRSLNTATTATSRSENITTATTTISSSSSSKKARHMMSIDDFLLLSRQFANETVPSCMAVCTEVGDQICFQSTTLFGVDRWFRVRYTVNDTLSSSSSLTTSVFVVIKEMGQLECAMGNFVTCQE